MADALSIDHYIGECFVKCAQVILGSRIFQAEHERAPSDKRSGRWFKLEVEELGSLSARLDPWRRDVYTPLVIEIHIQPWDSSAVMPAKHGSGAVGTDRAQGTLLERWTLSYSPTLPRSSTTCSRAAMDSAAVYKYLILLIRSLYSFVHILPAYRMYRACKRHGADLFNTQFTLSTAPLQLQQQHPHRPAAGAVRQHAGASGSKMCQFHFSPVETVNGQFEVSVEYQPATTVHFLEQTTVLPCAPRIISDYVDGPYAKSAPNSAHRLLGRAHSSNAAADRTNRASDGSGALSFLQPSQPQAPLVRHSWSSKDVAAPLVQRGFNPVARSNSLNASTGINSLGSMGKSRSSSAAIQQQHHLSLHHRSFSPGGGSGSAAETAGSSTAAVAAASAPCPMVAGSSSPVVFYGPSSLGRPPLPHSPAFAGQAGTAGTVGYSSVLPGAVGYHSGGLGGAASSGLPPASPGTPSSSVRTGTSPLLLRSASAGAAAVSSAAAAAAAAAGAAAGAAAAALTSTSLGSAAAGHLSRLGSSFGSSPLGAPRVLGFGLGQQQQRPRVQQDVPQSTHQGFVVKESTAAGCRGGSSTAQWQQQEDEGEQEEGFTPASDADLLAAAAAAAEQERQQQTTEAAAVAAAVAVHPAANYEHAAAVAGSSGRDDASNPRPSGFATPGVVSHLQQQQQQQASDTCGSGRPDATSATAAAAANLNIRAISAPVMIPGRGKGKARSVTDLPLMEAEMQLQQQHQPGHYQPAAVGAAAGVAGLNPRLATSPWLSQASRTLQLSTTAAADRASGFTAQHSTSSISGLGTCTTADGPTGLCSRVSGAPGTAGLSRAGGSLLGVQQGQQRQQQPKPQLVQVPSSAPAAPRGMLGQLLSGQTSPSFSPRGGAAATAAPGTYSGRATEAAGDTAVGEATGAGLFELETEGTAAASDRSRNANSSAAVQPVGVNAVRSTAIVIMPASTAPAAAGASVSHGSGSSSGALHSRSHQGCPAVPHTPGAAAAATLNMLPSILSSSPQLPFAFTPSAASLGMSLMSLADQHKNFLGTSGPGNVGGMATRGSAAGGVAAVAGSVGGSGTGAVGSLGRGGGSSIPRSPLGASSAAGSAAVSRQDSSTCAAASVGVGTPSPSPHVSCIRDITGLATIRRPSWSSRSSSFDVAASVSLPHHLSMSPMLGDLLDPALLDCSGSQGSHGAGRAQQLAAGRGAGGRSNSSGRGVIMTPAVVLPGGFGSSQQDEVAQSAGSSMAAQGGDVGDKQRDLLGQNSDAACASGQCNNAVASANVANDSSSELAGGTVGGAHDAGAAIGGSGQGGDMQQLVACATPDESESDTLPFALDTEACVLSHVGIGQGATGYSGFGVYQHPQQQQHGYKPVGVSASVAVAGGPEVMGAPATAAAERDVAVGAFMKLVQEVAAAPPFTRSRGQLQQQQQQQQVQADSNGQHQEQQQQRQQLRVGDAVQQVQQLAAQLQALVFSNSAAGF